MNEPQKRAYIILHAELSIYDLEWGIEIKSWVAHDIINRTISILKGSKMAPVYHHIVTHARFNREIQKILHLTDMPTEDMIAVLEKLEELWAPR